MKLALVIGAAALAGAFAFAFWPEPQQAAQQAPKSDAAGGALVAVLVPEALSSNAQIGKRVFDITCASCHGPNGAGQDGIAPPLIHKIYEPGHHGDESFQRAAAAGVRAHHWQFGNMPPLEGITRGDVAMIITYIRELQRANGIN